MAGETILGGVPILDFSAIGEFPERMKKAQLERARAAALADLQQKPDGSFDYATAARKVFQAGDTETGISLARLADAASLRAYERGKDDRDFDLRKRQLDATLEGGKVPAGFEKGPDGGLRHIAGGPADPAYIRDKEKPRQFSVTDVTKLTEEGAKYKSLSTFGGTFEDRFAGYGNRTVGNVANALGRNLPEGVVGGDVSAGASWWQNYDRFKNVVRNELFGASLTKGEADAFEKADINPGMTPDQIRKNLKTQTEVAREGLKRKANTLIQSGYDPKAIGSAYGLDVNELDAPRGGGAAPAGATKPAPKLPPGYTVDRVFQEAQAAIKNGKNPAAVMKRLREMGFE